MSALRRLKVQISRWWTVPPLVIVLAFHILLERKRPMISGPVHFLILIGASVISFGLTFSFAWLIGPGSAMQREAKIMGFQGLLRDPWKNS
jgi:hypothetical protein